MRFEQRQPSPLWDLAKQLALCMALILVFSMTAGCATASTYSSRARTERPALPAYPASLGQTETLEPLTRAPSGRLVAIDEAIWAERNERFADALGAIERLNLRIVGNRELFRCTASIVATGRPGKGCPDIEQPSNSGKDPK